MIKKFLLILVLIFSFQSLIKADDISDFEIEGISIGDSLLDYMNEKEIINIRETYYNDDTYSSITIFPNEYSFKVKFYDALVLSYKTNDNKFLLKGISGIMRYKKNVDECYEKMNEVINDLTVVFPNINPTKIKKSNLSLGKITYSDFVFNSKNKVTVKCTEYYENENNYVDNLRLAINTKEFLVWLSTIAYE